MSHDTPALRKARRATVAGGLVLSCLACGSQVALGQATPWTGWKIHYEVGAADTSDRELFASIRDAALLPGGRVVVLDNRLKTFRLIDEIGRVRWIAGRGGQGPGEFVDPAALAVSAQTVTIFDAGRHQLSVFELGDTSARHSRTVALPFGPRDGCYVGQRLFVLGRHEGRVIHEIAANGTIMASIGALPSDAVAGARDPIVAIRNFERGGSHLVCASDNMTLIHVTEQLGEVSAYRLDGTLVWAKRVNGFVEIIRTPRSGGIRMDLDPKHGYAHRVASAADLGAGLLQVVITQTFARGDKRDPAVFAVLLRTRDGAEVGRVNAPPEFLDVDRHGAVSRSDTPVPIIQYWKKGRQD